MKRKSLGVILAIIIIVIVFKVTTSGSEKTIEEAIDLYNYSKSINFQPKFYQSLYPV